MPQLIKVFQIVIDKHLADLINKEGWDCHVKAKSYIESRNGKPSIGLAKRGNNEDQFSRHNVTSND